MRVQWLYSRGGQKVLGPRSSSELKMLASTGLLLPNDGVRRQGMVHPVQAGDVKNLFAAPDGQTF
jgi:GYF domain 2